MEEINYDTLFGSGEDVQTVGEATTAVAVREETRTEGPAGTAAEGG
jgi:hypothetical protein